MKASIFVILFSACLFTAEISAQSQCKKGHFIFGSDLFQYSGGATTEKYNGGTNNQDTVKNTFSNVSYGFNVWVGYFVSNRVCVGLNYDFAQSALEYYLYPYYYAYYPTPSFLPSNLFFRYYITHADSGGVFDLALEGTFGMNYTSTTNNNTPQSTGTTIYTTTSVTYFLNLNSSINLLASFHISKHFAVQLMGGLALAYQNVNFVSESVSPPSPGFTFTPEKGTYTTDMFTGSLRLQFYL